MCCRTLRSSQNYTELGSLQDEKRQLLNKANIKLTELFNFNLLLENSSSIKWVNHDFKNKQCVIGLRRKAIQVLTFS